MQELGDARLVAIVAAHPDDEMIGAGALLPYLRDVHIIHITDGAPRDPSDARHAGFDSSEAYANARREELEEALALAEIPPEKSTSLHFTDQETMHHIPSVIAALADLLHTLRPAAILTHPYEGGHPDHDTAALAAMWGRPSACQLFEMTSYHFSGGVFQTGCFLPNGTPTQTRPLPPHDYARKQQMFSCFRTQKRVLSQFPIVPEQFRPAPTYDFAQPPHPGRLHYESLPWGITGAQWRALAAQCR